MLCMYGMYGMNVMYCMYVMNGMDVMYVCSKSCAFKILLTITSKITCQEK